MKKILNFKSNDKKYILENTNPNERREPFAIDINTMEFNTTDFYEYVFSDIDNDLDIEVVNLTLDSDKVAQRTYSTIVDICDGVIAKMKRKCFSLEE